VRILGLQLHTKWRRWLVMMEDGGGSLPAHHLSPHITPSFQDVLGRYLFVNMSSGGVGITRAEFDKELSKYGQVCIYTHPTASSHTHHGYMYSSIGEK
jgi:hypothetical protein